MGYRLREYSVPRTPTRSAYTTVADTTDHQTRVTGSSDPNNKGVRHEGTPRTIKVGQQGHNIDPKKRRQYIKAVNDEMTRKWGFIDDVDDWFDECLQGQTVPPEILDEVGDKFSAVPHSMNGAVEVNYYPVLVCGVTFM